MYEEVLVRMASVRSKEEFDAFEEWYTLEKRQQVRTEIVELSRIDRQRFKQALDTVLSFNRRKETGNWAAVEVTEGTGTGGEKDNEQWRMY